MIVENLNIQDKHYYLNKEITTVYQPAKKFKGQHTKVSAKN